METCSKYKQPGLSYKDKNSVLGLIREDVETTRNIKYLELYSE